MKGPRPKMVQSVLANAELYRRGMLFEGVPSQEPELELPPQAGAEGNPVQNGSPAIAQPAAAVPAGDDQTTDQLVAGAVENKSPLETMVAGP